MKYCLFDLTSFTDVGSYPAWIVNELSIVLPRSVQHRDIVMRSFTLIGGSSIEFHAIPIFTVLAVKMRKISGKWVRFLLCTMNTACKSHGYLENFTPYKSLWSPWKHFKLLNSSKSSWKNLKFILIQSMSLSSSLKYVTLWKTSARSVQSFRFPLHYYQ